jgi:hypothetical protein
MAGNFLIYCLGNILFFKILLSKETAPLLLLPLSGAKGVSGFKLESGSSFGEHLG